LRDTLRLGCSSAAHRNSRIRYEFGYLPSDPNAAELFFRPVLHCYERKPRPVASSRTNGNRQTLSGDPVLPRHYAARHSPAGDRAVLFELQPLTERAVPKHRPSPYVLSWEE
jgi:hypothetical protein